MEAFYFSESTVNKCENRCQSSGGLRGIYFQSAFLPFTLGHILSGKVQEILNKPYDMRKTDHLKTCRKTALEIPSCTIQPQSNGVTAKRKKKTRFGSELLFFQYMQYLLTINNRRNKTIIHSDCVRYFGTEEKTVT